MIKVKLQFEPVEDMNVTYQTVLDHKAVCNVVNHIKYDSYKFVDEPYCAGADYILIICNSMIVYDLLKGYFKGFQKFGTVATTTKRGIDTDYQF